MLQANLLKSDISLSDLYENLMVYLMFSGVHQIDYKVAHKVIENDFAKQYPGVDYEFLRKHFSQHLHNLLEVSFSPLNKDVEIIAQVRNRLKDFSPAMRGFNLLTELTQIRDLPYWRSQDAFGPLGTVAIKRRSGESLYVYTPGMYTSNAMTSVVLPAIPRVADTIAKEDWVLFNSTQKAANVQSRVQLRSDIIAIYVKNYIETWDHLLNDIDFNSFVDFKQEVFLLQSLIGPPSPVESFLQAVAKETTFAKEQVIVSDRNKENSTDAISLSDTNLFDDQKAKNYIDDHFAELHSFVTGTPNGISELLKNLNTIKSILAPIASANNILSPDGGKLVSNSVLGQNLEQLQSIVIKSPSSIEDAVSNLIRQTTVLIESSAQEDIESGWKDGVYKFCKHSINNHFPFSNTNDDVTINDFIKIFAPDGVIDQFYNKYISSYVDTSKSPWTLLVDTNSKINITPTALRLFEQAYWIKKVFFPGGAKEPRISFGIMPADLDIKAKSVSLDIGGQSLLYQYGSQQMQTMLWPNGNNNVRINFANTESDQSKSLFIEGPWALFRLIQKQKFEKLSSTRFMLYINFSGRYANFIIEAATVENPFLRNLMRGFNCPASLVLN
jgi:type VI secretion system protein ImpL